MDGLVDDDDESSVRFIFSREDLLGFATSLMFMVGGVMGTNSFIMLV